MAQDCYSETDEDGRVHYVRKKFTEEFLRKWPNEGRAVIVQVAGYDYYRPSYPFAESTTKQNILNNKELKTYDPTDVLNKSITCDHLRIRKKKINAWEARRG